MIHNSNSFYTVDGVNFESKIEACLFAQKVGKDITWNFNKEFFSSYDWSKEPDKTLDQLYNERAQRLRDHYDYIILSYSGGADSHNILMSFIRQGLHIDEIVVNHMSDAWKNFVVLDANQKASWNTGAEHNLHTIPMLKRVEHLIPNTKITILDLSQNLFSTFNAAGDASWVLERTEGLNPLNVTRFNYAYFDDVRKRFDKEHKIAMVVGVDKPRTCIHKDNFYMFFIDRAVNIVPVNNHFKEYTNSAMEFFYWSPDAVDMMCKQIHVVKRFVESNPVYLPIWQWDDDYVTNFRKIHEQILRNVLYTNWDSNWFQTEKALGDWSSEFDEWFIKGYKDTSAHTIWEEGLKHMIQHAPRFIKYKKGVADGLVGFSQYYKIGKVNYPLVHP